MLLKEHLWTYRAIKWNWFVESFSSHRSLLLVYTHNNSHRHGAMWQCLTSLRKAIIFQLFYFLWSDVTTHTMSLKRINIYKKKYVFLYDFLWFFLSSVCSPVKIIKIENIMLEYKVEWYVLNFSLNSLVLWKLTVEKIIESLL